LNGCFSTFYSKILLNQSYIRSFEATLFYQSWLSKQMDSANLVLALFRSSKTHLNGFKILLTFSFLILMSVYNFLAWTSPGLQRTLQEELRSLHFSPRPAKIGNSYGLTRHLPHICSLLWFLNRIIALTTL